MSARSVEDKIQIGFRISKDLLTRVDGYIKILEASTPGLRHSRTDAVIVLLTKALDQGEQENVTPHKNKNRR